MEKRLSDSGRVVSRHGLEEQGLKASQTTHWNLVTATLVEHAVCEGSGMVADGGPLVVRTGAYTGRSPNDKFIVEESGSSGNIWWGDVNRGMSEAHFDGLLNKISRHLEARNLYVQDLYAGADASYRLPVRVISESPGTASSPTTCSFARRKPISSTFSRALLSCMRPAAMPTRQRTAPTANALSWSTSPSAWSSSAAPSMPGRSRKSIFSVLNYLLPDRDVLPMHCSANIGPDGDTAIFFGLSGTGKTTLSADASRVLIGDDEHGWSDRGVLQLRRRLLCQGDQSFRRGGARIYATTRRFGTLLENVVIDPETRRLDLDDNRYTENTRASYPLDFVPNASETGLGAFRKTW